MIACDNTFGTAYALITDMQLGIAMYAGRVSPVLDVAQRLLVVDIAGQQPMSRHDVPLAAATLHGRAQEIQAAGVEVLVCGALSRALEAALTAAGVQVVPQTCGDIEDVLQAYLAGQLTQSAFLMPGCCGRRRRRGGRGGNGRGMRGRRGGA